LLTEEEYHRAAPGGTGDIKTIGNFASVMSNFARHSYGSSVTLFQYFRTGLRIALSFKIKLWTKEIW
jgi:hypothetical protein